MRIFCQGRFLSLPGDQDNRYDTIPVMAMAMMLKNGTRVFWAGPDGVGPGGAGISPLSSSAIFLVADWPSDWFPVMVTVNVPGLEYWWVTGRSSVVMLVPSFQSTFTDTMVAPGDPTLMFPFRVTFIRSSVGSKRVRTGGCITMSGPPGTVIVGVTGTVTGMTGWPAAIFVVPILICPSDCRTMIDSV